MNECWRPSLARYRTCWNWTLLLAAMAGCGGGGTPPSPVVTAPPPPAPKAVAVQAMAPANAAAPAARDNRPINSPAGDTPATNRFPKESANNVFVVQSTGSTMVATAVPEYLPTDRFQVTVGTPGSNSSQFTVAAGTPSGNSATRNDWKLPDGFQALAEYGVSSDGYPLRIRGKTDGKLMAFVPGGTVQVGSANGPEEVQAEFVTFLDPFYMDVTEITVADFEKFREAQREAKKRVPTPALNANSGRNAPVLGITWGDASVYARWVGKELPTEAQFEKAARGSQGFRHPWGDGRPIWSEARTPKSITDVARFAGDQSPYGVFDLAGNAREWVSDWYDPKAHQEAARIAARQTLVNWTGPKKSAQGNQRVIKGAGPQWQVYYRWGAGMGERIPDVGFRCVLPVIAAPATPAAT